MAFSTKKPEEALIPNLIPGFNCFFTQTCPSFKEGWLEMDEKALSLGSTSG